MYQHWRSCWRVWERDIYWYTPDTHTGCRSLFSSLCTSALFLVIPRHDHIRYYFTLSAAAVAIISHWRWYWYDWMFWRTLFFMDMIYYYLMDYIPRHKMLRQPSKGIRSPHYSKILRRAAFPPQTNARYGRCQGNKEESFAPAYRTE